MKPGDDLLLRYVAGVLDPAAAAGVAAWIEQDPGLAARVRALSDELDALPPPAPGPRLPPPGLGMDLAAGAPPVMGPARLRVGDALSIHLAPRDDVGERALLVLRRLGRDPWQVVAPGSAAQVVPLSRVPVEADGRHRVDLRLSGPPGLQRWAIALPLLATHIDWAAAEPWAAVLADVEAGRVPVGSTEVEVQGR